MKTTPKTAAIVRALRNRTSKAAKLARYIEPRWTCWNRHEPEAVTTLPARLANLRSLPDYHGKTLAEKYRYASNNADLELSAPEADSPLLWFDGTDSPEILHHWQGRDFLKHNGWYTDDYQDETLEAYAVQLADFPGLIFEAVRQSCGGSIRVNLADFHAIDYRDSDCDYNAEEAREDTAKEAIQSADSTAKREAEEEQIYQAEERHRLDLEEARAELGTIRADFRRLAAELRRLCPSTLPTDYPAAADAIRAQVKQILRHRAETLDTIAEHKAALA